MDKFIHIRERAEKRKGGAQILNELLSDVASDKSLRNKQDDRYLSQMTQCIFNAGFHWAVIRKKWPDFEKAFYGFDIPTLLSLSPEEWEGYMNDTRIVRNWQKIKTVWHNAQMIEEIAAESNSFADFFVNWPVSDQIGLMDYLKKNGERLGGQTGQYFIRFIGKDGFITSKDVCVALIAAGIDIKEAPSSKRDLKKIQDAFNHWHDETGLPYSHISKILAYSVGENYDAEDIKSEMAKFEHA